VLAMFYDTDILLA